MASHSPLSGEVDRVHGHIHEAQVNLGGGRRRRANLDMRIKVQKIKAQKLEEKRTRAKVNESEDDEMLVE